MRFASVEMANLLWAVIIICAFFYWASRRKRMMMERFAQRQLIEEITPSVDVKKNKIRIFLFVCIFVLSSIALMRPQWGFEWQEIKQQGIDIIVGIDVSKSMLTEDVKPSRLERSKLAVKDLIRKLKGDRVGLVAFAGSAFLACPLTVDYSGFLLALDDLTTQTIPSGGTAIASVIQESIKSYDKIPSKYKAVIIITDGENLQGDPLAAAEEAKKNGIKISCIGIGTREGELIRIVNEQGQPEFLKDKEGHFVKSRLNEKLLEKIALTTGGTYIRASGAQFGLDVIYEQRLSKMEKRELKAKMDKRYHERFQIPLALAFILLIVETCIGNRKRK